MGYEMTQEAGKVVIPAASKDAALAALKAMFEAPELMGGGMVTGGETTRRWFSWMNLADPDAWTRLEDALEDWRWPPVLNRHGDIVNLRFRGQKFGDDEKMFHVLAPFVESGGYIQMLGEDGDRWRWRFVSGRLIREAAAHLHSVE